jgi:tetratricopeptide (TPR) repeat protein
MNSSPLPTENPEALMAFVQGRNALQSYLGSGRSEDLERAREGFSAAHHDDPAFDLASFYLAVASTELRDSQTAIEILEPLTNRAIDFLPEALLHLAYAYTKTYESPAFLEAERALDKALQEASRRARPDLTVIIKAYQVFLYSVMAGRYDDKSARPRYVQQAIQLGQHLLIDPVTRKTPARDQILFELHNALGIAYWRKGENEPPFSDIQSASWTTAHTHFDKAMRIRPNATRALQNLGSLLIAEGDQFAANGQMQLAEQRYLAARKAYVDSLALNPVDQFPHYRVSWLAARLGDWQTAEQYFDSGRQQPGAVNAADWEKLKRAIDHRDPNELTDRPTP